MQYAPLSQPTRSLGGAPTSAEHKWSRALSHLCASASAAPVVADCRCSNLIPRFRVVHAQWSTAHSQYCSLQCEWRIAQLPELSQTQPACRVCNKRVSQISVSNVTISASTVTPGLSHTWTPSMTITGMQPAVQNAIEYGQVVL